MYTEGRGRRTLMPSLQLRLRRYALFRQRSPLAYGIHSRDWRFLLATLRAERVKQSFGGVILVVYAREQQPSQLVNINGKNGVDESHLRSPRVCRQQSPVDIRSISYIRRITILGSRVQNPLNQSLGRIWLSEEEFNYSSQGL